MKNNSAFSSRKFKYGSLSVAMTCVIVAAIILFNGVFKMLADKYLWYTDLTRDEIYTLSEVAVEALANVDKDVHILFCDDPATLTSLLLSADHLDCPVVSIETLADTEGFHDAYRITFTKKEKASLFALWLLLRCEYPHHRLCALRRKIKNNKTI